MTDEALAKAVRHTLILESLEVDAKELLWRMTRLEWILKKRGIIERYSWEEPSWLDRWG